MITGELRTKLFQRFSCILRFHRQNDYQGRLENFDFGGIVIVDLDTVTLAQFLKTMGVASIQHRNILGKHDGTAH